MPQKDVSDDSDFNGASSSSISTSDTFPQNVSHRRLSVRYFIFLSLSFSPCFCFFFLCVCLVFVLNMDCVCLSVCVCESVCSRNCVAYFLQMPTMAMAMVSAAWNTFFVSMETGMICPQPETCSMLRPPFSPHSVCTLVSFRPDRSVTGKTTRFSIDNFSKFASSLLVSLRISFSKLSRAAYTENNLNPQRVLGIKKFKAIKSSHHQPPLGSHSATVGQTNRRRPVISWEKDR